MKRLLYLFLFIEVISFFMSCKRSTDDLLQIMNEAEKLMFTQPDSAFYLLETINQDEINDNNESAARYALLKSIALDKNYIDTTEFDVLQPAIDYYLINGTPDEQLLTYYYQGRIFQNKGQDEEAMKSFIKALELSETATDTLILAHTLVAQGTLFFKQYQIEEFIDVNIRAAELYAAIDKPLFEIKSYANAIDGEIIIDNRANADSLIKVLEPLLNPFPEGYGLFYQSYIAYIVKYGEDNELRQLLKEFSDQETSSDVKLDLARGFIRIGEGDRALDLLSNVNIGSAPRDSFKYLLIKSDANELIGDYKEALKDHKQYSEIIDEVHYDLFKHNLRFAQELHNMEVDKLKAAKARDSVMIYSLCSIFLLIIVISLIYYSYRLNKEKRIVTEKENERLLLEEQANRLEIEKQRIALDNLNLEKLQLEDERNKLQNALVANNSRPIQDVIKHRLEVLNGLLAKEITDNDTYAKPYNQWIASVRNDKEAFLKSTREALKASYPVFFDYLIERGLTDDEINYVCLYAIGLRGKDIGIYTKYKRHYHISSDIRKKFGLDLHNTNLGIHIRRLMKDGQLANK